MKRRAFLAFPGAMALGALASRAAGRGPAVPSTPRAGGLRLGVTWGMMRNFSVPDGLALLDRLGYDGFEMFDWSNESLLNSFAAEKKKYPGLACICLIANKGVTAPGCGLINPRERENFIKQINMSVEAAKKVDCRRLVVLTGNELGGMSREQQMNNIVASMKAAAPILEKNGITAVIEVLNTFVDHSGYFLYYIRDGAEICERVGSNNVKILFDLYHTQVMEGNLISNARTFIPYVGHFHVGDHPGRHEPGTGEINYRNVFKAIYDLGDKYAGYVSLEYGAVAPIQDNLPAMRQLTTFG
jgi:hydroxypyruvate isomerase